MDIAKNIGTIDLSIEPHKDCCSIFLPKSPITKSRIEHVLMQEENVEMNNWVPQVMKNYEIKIII